ncbi:hypothetical protein [Rhizobium sp. BK251]|uniref:hypothetical protein n=1 Tax=Rhizobium sp. BK251 TaxID=2512125 RepID=UPI0010455F81|nr:hypothetical protein [Rhizobium sp. BK251]TCL74452.1 hypothetical protein EV286_10212 [Rhizobium sp. BK251]
MLGFLRRKSSKPSELLRIPGKEFGAAVGAAMNALRELEDIAKYAKARLRKREEVITQTDLESLLAKLVEAKERIEFEKERDITKAEHKPDTEWDGFGYNQIVTPTLRMGNAPKEIIDLTLAAADHGAKSAELLYKLVIAEMDVAVARYYVTMNSHLVTS